MVHGKTAVVPEVAVTLTIGTSKLGESVSPSAEIQKENEKHLLNIIQPEISVSSMT